jgi:DNA polymerase-3 subunit delta
MTPDEFLRSITHADPAPVYLFVGPEAWMRGRCRRALIERALAPEDRDEGFVRHDLGDMELSSVIDDARSLSLFAPRRIIWASSAEAALPKGRIAATQVDEDGTGKLAAAGPVADYVRNPVPGVVLVFDCSRFDLEGDDKSKVQRVQKFYGSIRHQVEFERFHASQARRIAQEFARERGLQIGEGEIELLVEVVGPDAVRITREIEKLALYAGSQRRITPADIHELVPNAKASTIFALVNAIGRNDRPAALESLDLLVREGEYLPLALSFLATQFRLALAAKEARLTTASQVQSFFQRQGTPMWRGRAEQVAHTAVAFPLTTLRKALAVIYNADKSLRDVRPDDRTVMEQLVLRLTGVA